MVDLFRGKLAKKAEKALSWVLVKYLGIKNQVSNCCLTFRSLKEKHCTCDVLKHNKRQTRNKSKKQSTNETFQAENGTTFEFRELAKFFLRC